MLAWCVLFMAMAAAGTWLARRYAMQRRLLDQPGERRSHAVATPRGGGVGIVAAMLVAGLALAFRFPSHAGVLGAFSGGLLMIAAVGWLDDHRPVSPWWRLAVHLLAGAGLGVAVWEGTGIASGVGAFVAVAVLTNVWNFMDGINGMASSQAALAAMAVALVASGPLAALGWAMVGACVGFLPFNFPRAWIFLGDVGSGALGFTVAALVVLAVGWVQAGQSPRLLLLLPLAPFLVDAGLTLLRRMIRRERWWTPHTQHAYQVWARDRGHTAVTLLYAGASAAGVAAAVLLADRGVVFMAAVCAAWYTSAALAWLWLQHPGQPRSGSDRSMRVEG